MRKITGAQIAVFFALLGLALALGIGSAWALLGALPLGDFRGIVLVTGALLASFLFAILAYRLFLRFFPLIEGKKPEGSRGEFIYHVYVLFLLMVFYPVMFPGFLPIPIARRLYMALGARIGPGSYGPTCIVDPPLTEIGAHCVLGQGAIIACHHIVGNRLVHRRVRIGDRVTIGGAALIGAGVTVHEGALIGPHCTISPLCEIGAGATILANSFLRAGTRVREGETWGGVPAQHIETRGETAAQE